MRWLFAVLAALLLIACNSAPSEPKKDLAFIPNPTQAAKELCAHLRAIGCEQHEACESERSYHLSTRDMRIECLMGAKMPHDAERCGTVTCPPASPRRP
jgi:hypothetical protein